MSCLFASADQVDSVDEVDKDSNAPYDDRSYYVKFTRDETHRAGGWFDVTDQLTNKTVRLNEERAIQVQKDKFVHANPIWLPDKNPNDYPFDHYFSTGTLFAWAAGTRNGQYAINVRHKRHECKDEGTESTAVALSPWLQQLENGQTTTPAGKAKSLSAWFSASMNIEPYIAPLPKVVVFNDPYVYGKEKLNNECLRCTNCNTNIKLDPAIRYPFTLPHLAPESFPLITCLIDSIQSFYRHKNEIAKAIALKYKGKVFKDAKAKTQMTAHQLLKMYETSFASTHPFYWYNFIAHALGDVSEHTRYQSTLYFAYERKQSTSLDLAKLDQYLQGEEHSKLPPFWRDENVAQVLILLRSFVLIGSDDEDERAVIIEELEKFRANKVFPTRNLLTTVDESPIHFHLGHKLSVYKIEKPTEKLTYGTQVVLTMMSCLDLAHYMAINCESITPSERELIQEFVQSVSTMVAPDLSKCPGHCALMSVINTIYGDKLDKPDSFWKAFTIVKPKQWSIKTWKQQSVTKEQISKSDLACFMLSPAPIITQIKGFGAVDTAAKKRKQGTHSSIWITSRPYFSLFLDNVPVEKNDKPPAKKEQKRSSTTVKPPPKKQKATMGPAKTVAETPKQQSVFSEDEKDEDNDDDDVIENGQITTTMDLA